MPKTSLLITGPAGKAKDQELTLVITSDRGLAGPYNGSILRTAMQHLKATPGTRDGVIELDQPASACSAATLAQLYAAI